MIYDIVIDSLASLENQWRELSQSFERLAVALGVPPEQLLQEGGQAGAVDLCEQERLRLEAERVGVGSVRPAIALFSRAIRIFEASEATIIQVERRFNREFPPSDTGAPELVEVIICRTQIERLQEFIARALQEFEEVTSIQGERYNVKGIRSSVDNLASYPLLTSGLGNTSWAPSATPAPVNEISLQRTVEGALRTVLGRLPKPNDTRSFLAALNQTFALQEVEGRVEYIWTPRSYAGQTELGGGVTGAQASLYSRARVALDNSLPLLDGLYPLLPEADPELADAARALVRSDMIELVNEFGLEGGPRVPRVDSLFIALLDQQTTDEDGLPIAGGHLGYLQSVFGLVRQQVNTLEEETNVTNFVVLQDYVQSLRDSWEVFRTQWLGRDLGTRLVLLSRALSVATEAVDEVYAAMDSVFVGPSERQVTSFRDEEGTPILIEELFSWVVTFTSDEAPRLVHEGGRRGVEAIVPTAQRLEQLVGRLIQIIPNEPTLPDGLRHPRVRHPLQELRSYLLQVQRLAQDVRRP
jgi:hypothetical protein